MFPSENFWITPTRVALHVLCAVPALWLLYRTFFGSLGVNPVQELTFETGIWALRLLLFSLAITPLRILTKEARLVTFRRPAGLWAFFYAVCHFSIYLTFDLRFSPAGLTEDILKRPYITVGFAALVLLIPLAVTSTRGWQRRLREKWKMLHKSVYLIAILAMLHFLWLTKGNQPEPVIYAGILAVLFAVRLQNEYARRARE